jgi:hypothetical protein
MKISKNSAIELKRKLPRGSVGKIRTRLKKRGMLYSQQYIYRCLNPYQDDYNDDIIDEAITLGEELTRKILREEERVTNLRNGEA